MHAHLQTLQWALWGFPAATLWGPWAAHLEVWPVYSWHQSYLGVHLQIAPWGAPSQTCGRGPGTRILQKFPAWVFIMHAEFLTCCAGTQSDGGFGVKQLKTLPGLLVALERSLPLQNPIPSSIAREKSSTSLKSGVRMRWSRRWKALSCPAHVQGSVKISSYVFCKYLLFIPY